MTDKTATPSPHEKPPHLADQAIELVGTHGAWIGQLLYTTGTFCITDGIDRGPAPADDITISDSLGTASDEL